MTSNLGDDLSTTITSAVQARTEAAVLAALSNDDTFGAFVVAALQQKIEIGSYSNKRTVSYVDHIVESSIKEHTKAIVGQEIEALAPRIREEVAAALGRSIGVMADSLVDGFVASAGGRYPSLHISFGDRES